MQKSLDLRASLLQLLQDLAQHEHHVVAYSVTQVLRPVGEGADRVLTVAYFQEVPHQSVAHERVEGSHRQNHQLHPPTFRHVPVRLPQDEHYLRKHVQLPGSRRSSFACSRLRAAFAKADLMVPREAIVNLV